MDRIIEVANKAVNLTIGQFMKELFNYADFRDLIIYLNTEKQLFQEGVNSQGVELSDIGGNYNPNYADFTGKKALNHIDLKDTGAFYNSFRTFLDNNNDIDIEADTIKVSERGVSDLIDRWGAEIIGLNENSITILGEFVKDKFRDIYLKLILE